ncbi:MAG TPA: cupredoxin domain-containing protein [Chloroflexota bacterium]
MTKGYGCRTLQHMVGAASAPLLLVAVTAPWRTSADAKGMPGMQMSNGPAQKSRVVVLKHRRTVRINVQDLAFRPARVIVSLGTTIIWTNQDGFQHTTTSDRGLWDSGPLNPGAHYLRAFKRAGTFTYHCTIHPFMHGSITVTK